MAPPSTSSSSAKKVARLAQRGKGKKVRFQGGSLFPAAVLIVVLVGLLTIFYARQSRPDPGSFPPQVGDHWHAAYGFYLCDTWLPKFADDKEAKTFDPSTGAEQYVSDLFAATGIHTHGDGVIHYHPYSTRSVGKRAKLGVFLDVYGVELTTTTLKIPDAEGGTDVDLDKGFECNGKDTEIKVVAWENFTDTGKGQTYITDLTDLAIKNDGMVFAIAVVPTGTDVSMPPWAADLPLLGAADQGNVPQTTIDSSLTTVATTVAGSDTASTVPGSGVTTGTGAPTSSATTPDSGTPDSGTVAAGSTTATGG